MPGGRRLLLLAPSRGFGGGIERVATATEAAWSGPVTRLDLYRSGRDARPSGSPAAKARLLATATATAARTRPALVLAVHVGLLPVAVAAARAGRARLGAWGHGVEAWGPTSKARRAQFARCDVVLASSAFTADRMAQGAGLDPARITTVALPLDAGLLARARGHERAADGATLLSVSRLAPSDRYKGHFTVAEAMPEIARRRPDARWVVVGDGEDAAALRGRCEALGVADRVEMTGPIDDAQLAARYAAATLFVLPSAADADATPPEGEGFGLVYAEAGAFGVPSVGATSAGGAAEVIRHDVTGWTVPPRDPAALAAAVDGLLDDPGRRARLGAAARELVLARHTPEHFAAELAEVAALARGAGPAPAAAA